MSSLIKKAVKTARYTPPADDASQPKVEKQSQARQRALKWMVARMKAMYKKCSQTAPCWDYIREVEGLIKP